MDDDQFDNLTRSTAAFRRPLLIGLGAGGFSGLFAALVNRVGVAANDDNGCKTDAGCDGKAKCIKGKCCPRKRVFVKCPVEDLCPDQPIGEPLCCSNAPKFCCPKDQTCGFECCHPTKQKCRNGECKPFLAATFVRVRRR
jgi:hypothetical protein